MKIDIGRYLKWFAVGVACVRLLLGGDAAAAVNYLKIVLTGTTVQYVLNAPNPYPQYYVTGAGAPCGLGDPEYWMSNGTYSLTAGPGTLSVTSSDINLTLSIQNTPPPTGSYIHYFGVNEGIQAVSTNTIYVAGVPSQINLKPVFSDTLTAVKLGSPAVALPGQFVTNPWGGSYVVPSILLPDQTLFVNTVPQTIDLGTYTYSAPSTGWCVAFPSSQYSSMGHAPAFGSTQTVPVTASMTMASPHAVPIYSCMGSGCALHSASSVALSASNSGGIIYKMTQDQTLGFIMGTVGYLVGF